LSLWKKTRISFSSAYEKWMYDEFFSDSKQDCSCFFRAKLHFSFNSYIYVFYVKNPKDFFFIIVYPKIYQSYLR